jgi:hypothetical protein
MAGAVILQSFRRLGAAAILLIGGGLGGWMALCGCMYLTVGRFPEIFASGLGVPAALRLGIPAFSIAWMLVCAGTFWFGAVCAFVLRPAWGWIVLTGIAALSLLFFPLGTTVALLMGLTALGWRCIPKIASWGR